MLNTFPIFGDVWATSRSRFVINTVDQSDVSLTKRQKERSSREGQISDFLTIYDFFSYTPHPVIIVLRSEEVGSHSFGVRKAKMSRCSRSGVILQVMLNF